MVCWQRYNLMARRAIWPALSLPLQSGAGGVLKRAVNLESLRQGLRHCTP